MTRLTREKIDAENELAAARATPTDLAGQLERALAVAGSCNRHYATAPPESGDRSTKVHSKRSTCTATATWHTLS